MIKLLVSIAICQLAGVIGSFFTVSEIPGWYMSLTKPGFNPPNWIFGPVWTTLYLLMGFALWLVWRKGLNNKKTRFAFRFFIAHLFINSFWSVVFFGLHNIAGAFTIILILWAMIVASIKLFWHIDRRAAWILVPYLAWVSFAAVLNYYLMVLN